MLRGAYSITAVICMLLALAGCGHSAAPRPPVRSTTATRTTAANYTISNLREADDGQAFSIAMAAIAHLRSYAITIGSKNSGTGSRLVIDVEGSSKQLVIDDGEGDGELVHVAGANYLRGDVAFWESTQRATSTVAASLANRWFKLPSGRETKVLQAALTPLAMERCLRSVFVAPKLYDGPAEASGVEAAVLQTAGGRPGTAPRSLYVQQAPPFYPLRVIQTGKPTPGTDPACGEALLTLQGITFSRWNAVTIRPPTDASPLP